MAKARRRGSETSETRALLLDVTERIMMEQGYAAISSRSVAKAAEVTPALVHYYFATLDDLFVAVLRRRSERHVERQTRMLERSTHPLHDLWDAMRDRRQTGLMLEFVALANHRKSIQAELAELAQAVRATQAEFVQQHLDRSDTEVDGLSALAIVTLVSAIASNSVLEHSIGIELGHREQASAVEQFLDGVEGPRPP